MRNRKNLALVLVFALLFTSLASAASYTVKTNDVLWKIAKENGTTWQELASRNNLKNPHLIYPGQVLSLDGQPSASGQYKAGTYTAEVQGHNAGLTVEVAVSNTAITSVKVLSHQETVGISDVPLKRIPEQIVAKQSLAIDTITGATVSSKAVLAGAEACLVKAGANIALLKQAVSDGNKPAPQLVQKTTDIVIIGGGGAGMAAALAAAEAGSSSIVIEKAAALGGNTILAGGGYNAYDATRQKGIVMTKAQIETVEKLLAVAPKTDYHKQMLATLQKQFTDYLASGSTDVFDSVELHAIQSYDGGDYLANLELLYVMAVEAEKSIGYLETRGLKWKPATLTYVGALWPRSHEAADYKSGLGFIDVYVNTIKKNNYPVEIIFETSATELIVENGKVVGTKAVGYDGTTYELRAKNAVILATGGFGANKDMLATYKPSLPRTLGTTNSPTLTGDGIKMAEKLGAQLVNMDQVQLLPTCDPKNGAASGYVGQATAIYVNKEGKRFVNELERRDVLTAAAIAQTDSIFYLLTTAKNAYLDKNGVNKFGQPVEDLIKQGKVVQADTLEEMAQKLGMPVATLKDTVDKFNKASATGIDPEFGRNAFAENILLSDGGPYYATPRTPSIHHTMGGLVIDSKCAVYDVNGKAIPGLLAAGEITGQIHGTNRIGANAIPDALCFGKIAGEVAASMGK